MQLKTIVALFGLLISTSAATEMAKEYKLGVVIAPPSSSQASSDRRRAFEHFAGALSEHLKEPVTLEALATPGEEAAALESGRIDMALVKAVTYGRAKERKSGIAGLVTVVSANDNEEVTTHSGYIVALQASDIDQLTDLKGKRFGFVRHSASGMVYPIAYLSQHDLNYRSDFSEHRCYRDHEEMMAALGAGEIDAGTTYRLPSLERNRDLAHLKVIARITDIPNPLIAVSASLSEEERRKITTALTSLPEGAFQGVGFFGLKAIDERLYEPVTSLGVLDVCP